MKGTALFVSTVALARWSLGAGWKRNRFQRFLDQAVETAHQSYNPTWTPRWLKRGANKSYASGR